MNQRDAWDIISSTLNGEILETLNQSVAIHLEDTNHTVVDVREFPINHMILLLQEISPARHVGPRIYVLGLSRNKRAELSPSHVTNLL